MSFIRSISIQRNEEEVGGAGEADRLAVDHAGADVALSNVKIRTYCTLFLAWNGQLEKAVAHLKNHGLTLADYVDNESIERKSLFRRLKARNKEYFSKAKPFRHNWSLSSRDHVESKNFERHFEWVFSHIPRSKKLKALADKGFRVNVTCFWESNGFGGGPVITARMSKLLHFHNVNLDLDIYPG